MKNKSKKIIIIAITILIIAIIGTLILIRGVKKNLMSDAIEYEGKVTINNTLEKVATRSNYYIVKNIIEKYYTSLCSLNKTIEDVLIFEYDEETKKLDEEIAKEIENNKNKIYCYFAENYIKETKLNTDNLQDKLGDYKDLYVLIKDMYVRDISGFLKVYFAFGTLTEKQTLETEDFELMIVIDEKHRTFDIYTSDYIDKNNLYELSKNEKFNLGITEIENRKYNTYKYESINDETYATDLLNSYTQSIKYNGIDYSYDKLDKEYKEKKFNEKVAYEEYVNTNKKEITTALLEYYKVNKYDNYTEYMCIDRKGKTYIFKENAIMDYDLILDAYTIDLPEFIEKYEIASTQEKVMLNIQKIVEALNSKDYKYVYSKLAEEFKTNYFKTYEEFERYAKKTFDIGNEIVYNNYTESENLCTYKITLKGKNKTVTKTIVIKLEEGTDFVMSFNVE